MTLRLAATIFLSLSLMVGCGGSDDPGDDTAGDDTAGDDTTGDDTVDPPQPTSLERCADPETAVEPAWEVDNIRAPLIGLTVLDRTILVSSEDGAVKTWDLPAAGGAPTAPHYGTPFIDDGQVMRAIAAATPGGTDGFVGLDVTGRAHVWDPSGTALADPIQLVAEEGTFVALDADHTRVAGGTAAFAGGLAVADLATGEVTGPLETELWGIAAARFASTGALVSVGHWYGCAAIEVRDAADPSVVTGYWDSCHWDGPQVQGWFTAVAIAPDGSQAIAVGDSGYARFDLADIAAGPIALVQGPQPFRHVEWSVGDELAFAMGPSIVDEGASTVVVWSAPTTGEGDAVLRETDVPLAIGFALDPAAGLLLSAGSVGLVRGHACGE
jgi:hypothetical protein